MDSNTPENLKDNYQITTLEFPMTAYPDAVNIVNDLLKKYKIGIVTASGKEVVISDLTMLDFPIDQFFYIQTSEDTDVHKPDPKVFEPILQKLQEAGVTKGEIVYVGDGLRDFYAARDAGIRFIGITHGTTSKYSFEQEGAEVVDSLEDVSDLIS